MCLVARRMLKGLVCALMATSKFSPFHVFVLQKDVNQWLAECFSKMKLLLEHRSSSILLHCESKKRPTTFFRVITLPNVSHFLKFFYR